MPPNCVNYSVFHFNGFSFNSLRMPLTILLILICKTILLSPPLWYARTIISWISSRVSEWRKNRSFKLELKNTSDPREILSRMYFIISASRSLIQIANSLKSIGERPVFLNSDKIASWIVLAPLNLRHAFWESRFWVGRRPLLSHSESCRRLRPVIFFTSKGARVRSIMLVSTPSRLWYSLSTILFFVCFPINLNCTIPCTFILTNQSARSSALYVDNFYSSGVAGSPV